jgi:hypothetical protein
LLRGRPASHQLPHDKRRRDRRERAETETRTRGRHRTTTATEEIAEQTISTTHVSEDSFHGLMTLHALRR